MIEEKMKGEKRDEEPVWLEMKKGEIETKRKD